MSLLFTVLIVVAGPWNCLEPQIPTSASAAAPINRNVSVQGVSVHYLDWGGSGEALVFLPPACETAHIYGDIAQAFTDHFRVLGPATRGCAQSSQTGAHDLDSQLRELAGFLDALRINTATIAAFSASGGKAVRFARLYPARMRKLVIFDSVYSYVAPGFEERLAAAITRRLGGDPDHSAALHKRHFEAWELGAWSAAMERNLRDTYTVAPDGTLRGIGAPEWWAAYRADMKAGRYFETRISHPTLMFFAVDLSQERLKQFAPEIRADIRSLAEDTDRRRREQIDEFRKNGSHVRIIEMPGAAHYCFVHKPQEVIRAMRQFLELEPSQ